LASSSPGGVACCKAPAACTRQRNPTKSRQARTQRSEVQKRQLALQQCSRSCLKLTERAGRASPDLPEPQSAASSHTHITSPQTTRSQTRRTEECSARRGGTYHQQTRRAPRRHVSPANTAHAAAARITSKHGARRVHARRGGTYHQQTRRTPRVCCTAPYTRQRSVRDSTSSVFP